MRIPDLSDIPDLRPVAPNSEYDLRIARAKETKSQKTGREGILLICEIVGEENAENLMHTLWMPMEGDEPHKAQTMWRMIKEFLNAIGLPTDGVDTSDFEGMEFSAILGLEQDLSGRERNTIQRVV